MEPRLNTSKKWTSLPEEFLQQLRKSLKASFVEQSKEGRFIAEGRIYPSEILLQLGYLEDGRLKQVNFTTSLEYESSKDKVMDLLNLAIDCTASLLQSYFEDPENEPPHNKWTEINVENKQVFFMHTTQNTELERAADDLLGENSEGLVKDDFSKEDSKN